MIRQDDKSQTHTISLDEFRAKVPGDDSPGTSQVQKSTTAIAGERDKVDVFLIIVNPPFDLRSITLFLFVPANGTVR